MWQPSRLVGQNRARRTTGRCKSNSLNAITSTKHDLLIWFNNIDAVLVFSYCDFSCKSIVNICLGKLKLNIENTFLNFWRPQIPHIQTFSCHLSKFEKIKATHSYQSIFLSEIFFCCCCSEHRQLQDHMQPGDCQSLKTHLFFCVCVFYLPYFQGWISLFVCEVHFPALTEPGCEDIINVHN